MGFWKELLSSFLDLQSTESSSSRRSKNVTEKSHHSESLQAEGHSPGDLLSGTVEYVDMKYALIVSGSLKVIVYIGEITNTRISTVSDVLSVGESVDFVLQKYEERGWVVSISAVQEARARRALKRVEVGDLVSGQIIELKDNGVLVFTGDYRVWIRLGELAWEWIEHPAEVVSLGEQVDVKILRIDMPDDWLLNKRNRKAQAYASLRDCVPYPISPDVVAAFSGVPFKVWAVVKMPRDFDVVTKFVLNEIANDKNKEKIAFLTGLSLNTIDDVYKFLEELSLVKEWGVSRSGRDLLEAIDLAQELNNDPIRGLYLSSAPNGYQLLSLDEHYDQQPYPREWPRPAYNRRSEGEFVKAADEDIPEEIFARLVSEKQLSKLSNLMADSRIRVFLRRDGHSPWRATYISVPEHWMLSGLWRVFKPYSERVFRPQDKDVRCKEFLLVRCNAKYNIAKKQTSEEIYFEPATQTFWYYDGEKKLDIRNFPNYKNFPEIPVTINKELPIDKNNMSVTVEPESWCSIRIR